MAICPEIALNSHTMEFGVIIPSFRDNYYFFLITLVLVIADNGLGITARALRSNCRVFRDDALNSSCSSS